MAYLYHPISTNENKQDEKKQIFLNLSEFPSRHELITTKREKAARIVVTTTSGLGTGSTLGVGTGIAAGLGAKALFIGAITGACVSLIPIIIFSFYFHRTFRKEDEELNKDQEETLEEIKNFQNNYERRLTLIKEHWNQLIDNLNNKRITLEDLESLLHHGREKVANSYLLFLIGKKIQFNENILNTYPIIPIKNNKETKKLRTHHKRNLIKRVTGFIQDVMLHKVILGPITSFLTICGLGASCYGLTIALTTTAVVSLIPPLWGAFIAIGAVVVFGIAIALAHRYLINQINQREKELESWKQEANQIMDEETEKLNQFEEQFTEIEINLNKKIGKKLDAKEEISYDKKHKSGLLQKYLTLKTTYFGTGSPIDTHSSTATSSVSESSPEPSSSSSRCVIC